MAYMSSLPEFDSQLKKVSVLRGSIPKMDIYRFVDGVEKRNLKGQGKRNLGGGYAFMLRWHDCCFMWYAAEKVLILTKAHLKVGME